MIKLKVSNWLQWHYDFVPTLVVAPYDEEKWRDGKVYEFETLRELQNFVDTCDLHFTEETKTKFTLQSFGEFSYDLSIDTSEANLMVFTIQKTWTTLY